MCTPFAIVDGKVCEYLARPSDFMLMLRFGLGGITVYKRNMYDCKLILSYCGDIITLYPGCRRFYEKWYPTQCEEFLGSDHSKALLFYEDVSRIESVIDLLYDL
jgi:hypothetical protein